MLSTQSIPTPLRVDHCLGLFDCRILLLLCRWASLFEETSPSTSPWILFIILCPFPEPTGHRGRGSKVKTGNGADDIGGYGRGGRLCILSLYLINIRKIDEMSCMFNNSNHNRSDTSIRILIAWQFQCPEKSLRWDDSI